MNSNCCNYFLKKGLHKSQQIIEINVFYNCNYIVKKCISYWTINTQRIYNFFPYNFVWQFHPQFMINILLKSLHNNSALFLRCQRISHYDDMITHFLCKRRQGTTHLPSRRIVHTSLTMVHLNASWVMKFVV